MARPAPNSPGRRGTTPRHRTAGGPPAPAPFLAAGRPHLSFLGPGSEWFWSAVSAVAVVVTLYAIYRQLLIQRSLKEVQQFDDLSREWNSERFIRLRLVVAKALRDGGNLDGVGAAMRLGDWWDKVAGLVRAGHLGRGQMLRQWSPLDPGLLDHAWAVG